MDDATKRLIAAGAVGHLCLHRYYSGETGTDWTAAAAYAARTFPDASPAVIAELIACCVSACDEASYYSEHLREIKCGESVALS